MMTPEQRFDLLTEEEAIQVIRTVGYDWRGTSGILFRDLPLGLRFKVTEYFNAHTGV